MKTQSWYIQRVHTLWDYIWFTIVLTLKLMYLYVYCTDIKVRVHSERAHTMGSHIIYNCIDIKVHV
jgi:hypothetical protein